MFVYFNNIFGSYFMPCSDELIWVHFIFWPGMALLTYLVAEHNNYGLKSALLAAIGMKKFQRTLLINLVFVGTILGSTALAVWIIQTCPN